MHRRIPVVLLTATLAGCNRGEQASADTTPAAGAPLPATAPGGAQVGAPITRADVAAYELGLEGEIAVYEAGAARLGAASAAADSAAALAAMLPATVTSSAAEHAGIPRARYQELEYLIGSAVSRAVINPALARTLGGVDSATVASLPPEAQQRLRENLAQAAALTSDSVIYQGVPGPLLAHVKQRVAGRLGELWRRRLAVQGTVASGR